MKQFLFRLETVLRMRKTKEKKLQKELMSTQNKHAQWIEKKNTLENQTEELLMELRNKKERRMQETYSQILSHLKESLDHVNKNLSLHGKQLEEKKIRFEQAIIERKIVEKIKEKHYNQWRTKLENSEGALLDEIGSKQTSHIR